MPGDLSPLPGRVRALRERAYLAAPLDDLEHPLHDLAMELAHLSGSVIPERIPLGTDTASYAWQVRQALERAAARARTDEERDAVHELARGWAA